MRSIDSFGETRRKAYRVSRMHHARRHIIMQTKPRRRGAATCVVTGFVLTCAFIVSE